jgi:hypothetical protein
LRLLANSLKYCKETLLTKLTPQIQPYSPSISKKMKYYSSNNTVQ